MSKKIEPEDYLYGVKVVDIGDARVARGRTRREKGLCTHRNMTYDNHERRVWCNDCETQLELFDAFEALVNQWHKAFANLEQQKKEIMELIEANRMKVAAQRLSKEWQKHATIPACPHCGVGLFPDDFTGGISTRSAVLERQRRLNKEQDKPT